jgi:hypothetical protein
LVIQLNAGTEGYLLLALYQPQCGETAIKVTVNLIQWNHQMTKQVTRSTTSAWGFSLLSRARIEYCQPVPVYDLKQSD